MFTPELIEHFQSQSAIMEDQSVLHFGSPNEELNALGSGAIVCPIRNWVRISVTGNDRAKFLHNFCTNDIKGLATGKCCEAIFTDVKAKALAYTFILAGRSSLEIWMPAENLDSLLQHLNRYIITEDVTIQAVEDDYTMFAVIGSTAIEVATAATQQPANINACELDDNASFLCREWNQAPIVIISMPAKSGLEYWNRLTAEAVPSGEWLFDHQRICEGFPIFGQDISSDNLAPEAGRNSQAISYTKGCYLGQEPIARIDAMGHVNKQIFKCEATAVSADDIKPVALSSVSKLDVNPKPALTILAVKAVNSGENIVSETVDGQTYQLKATPLKT